MSDHQFIKEYIKDFSRLLVPTDKVIDQLILVRDLLLEVKNNDKKILIFGNGGSAAIASHFSVDLTKNAKIRCLNFNEAGLITCFANDYGFEYWAEKAIGFYGNEGDLLIVISSSGQSKNMINAVKAARNGNFHSVVTLSGFSEDNPLQKMGDINLWVNNKSYNFVENIHQIWLLAIVDLIIGKREYSA
ncbi:MAG: SIS domain-containing protein [Gammaproteobacteria bacterium]|jgi:D-sedoheptulose 7-phosphate isomerase|nr:SIS domain-containing protein [Gammaproteobacteria bacterium]